MRGSRFALLLLSALLLKISYVSTSQVQSITLLLPSGSFPLWGQRQEINPKLPNVLAKKTIKYIVFCTRIYCILQENTSYSIREYSVFLPQNTHFSCKSDSVFSGEKQVFFIDFKPFWAIYYHLPPIYHHPKMPINRAFERAGGRVVVNLPKIIEYKA